MKKKLTISAILLMVLIVIIFILLILEYKISGNEIMFYASSGLLLISGVLFIKLYFSEVRR